MKYLHLAIAMAALQSYTCAAGSTPLNGSTVVCESCPSTTAAPQTVTRSSAPKTSASAPAFTVIPNTNATSTTVPFTGAGSQMAAGSLSGVLGIAIAFVYAAL